MASVHAFSYRPARFSLQYPMEFCLENLQIPGVTRQVSDTGLLVRLSQPIERGTIGRVRWQFGGCLVELEVDVVSTEFLEAGLSFRFSSEPERQFVQMMVKVLARSNPVR